MPVVATIVAVSLATLLSMVIGELVPKNFALAVPRATAKIVIPFQTLFTLVFRPAIVVLNGTANAILRAVGSNRRKRSRRRATAEELRSLVRRSASEGSLDQDTATLLARTLVFADHSASDVMTPRPRIAGLDREASAQAVIDLARSTATRGSRCSAKTPTTSSDSCTSSRPSR